MNTIAASVARYPASPPENKATSNIPSQAEPLIERASRAEWFHTADREEVPYAAVLVERAPMDQSRVSAIGVLARILPAAAACVFIGAFLFVAVSRLAFPFELEWTEGAMLDRVDRVLAGQSLYVAPTLDFVPFPYPPLYFLVAAPFVKLLGGGFFPLRLLSFLAALGCLAVLYVRGARDGGGAWSGLLSAGLFAGAYSVCGYWYDLARVDSLCFLFVLLSIHFVRSAGDRPLDERAALPTLLPAGVFLALAFLTKQTAAIMGAFLALYSLAVHRRGALVFVGAAVVIGGGAWLLVDHLTGGWFSFFAVHLLTRLPIESTTPQGFWINDMPQLVPAGLLFLALLLDRATDGGRADAAFFGLLATGLVLASYVGRVPKGGSLNALIPACAASALAFGPAAARILSRARDQTPRLRTIAEVWVAALCLIQFALLAYDPRPQIPNVEDARAGRAFIAALAAVSGEVLVPGHGYLSILAGKTPYEHQSAIDDLVATDPVAGETLRAEFERAVADRRFAAIVLDERAYFVFRPEMMRGYREDRRVCPDSDAFRATTGVRTRPCFLYAPRPAGPARAGVVGPPV